MIFSEKLQLIRKSRGLTQEELAENLHVSRQAVAKWESGQTYPDINNLIAVSTIFGLTVDYLVKDNECEKELKLLDKGSEAALIDFLVQAKKQTYAAKKGKVASSRPMSQDYLYDSDDYLYIDTYLGNSAFSGEEAVWYKSQPIYSMNYQGRVLSESFSSDFLKAALLLNATEKGATG
ncbi:helix-turn-helix domain-containing protein [Candidatus Enterococcus clewellii]|uniref:HTH cro/C1-type domain-containing protein n=1 Tax=Candidatus Enterococcus clewellii TaxID=1834193 RepID=A0A242JWP4_9ENTE|nr:helix-turn-helix domain-containing protein [Enterococcus sp. 9E7_DIV0242]OTP06698.1 hypothetical protein A5888_004223 [Enterococcus sp. 9E7_DIV0242]